MNGFRKMQQLLREEGWYVDWALPCCQSCAWSEVPYEHEEGPFAGQEVDLSKVLFNHEQDCQVEPEPPEGLSEDEEEEWWESIERCETLFPEEQSESTFCFDGSKQGVKNLKAILPIIEECGCKVHWNGKGDTRPDISWELE